jgi:hypothetical protein
MLLIVRLSSDIAPIGTAVKSRFQWPDNDIGVSTPPTATSHDMFFRFRLQHHADRLPVRSTGGTPKTFTISAEKAYLLSRTVMQCAVGTRQSSTVSCAEGPSTAAAKPISACAAGMTVGQAIRLICRSVDGKIPKDLSRSELHWGV